MRLPDRALAEIFPGLPPAHSEVDRIIA
jgi:hypothetical protein